MIGYSGGNNFFETRCELGYLLHIKCKACSIFVPSVLVTTMIDVRPCLDAKRAAIAAHASQVPETSSPMTMPAATFADVYGYEWYVRTGPAGIIDELG